MNATKWNSLSELIKYLGREGICRVEESEKGMQIGWIDDSPEALRRQEALRRKALQDQGDEEIEQRMLREQIKRAQAAGSKRSPEEDEGVRELKREDGEKVKLSFGAKPESTTKPAAGKPETKEGSAESADTDKNGAGETKPEAKPGGQGGFSMKMGAKPPATKNVFAQAKKSKPKVAMSEQPKKMSEAERIMKEEMERKRGRAPSGFGGPSKRQKFNGH